MGAYVPPHRRQNPGSESEGDLPPFECRNLRRTMPRLDIEYGQRAISKLYMLCAEEHKLRFQYFESGAQPIPGMVVGRQRYRLTVVDSHDRTEGRDSRIIAPVEDSVEARGRDVHQGQRITTRLEEDFRAALYQISNFRGLISLEPTRPTLWLRFGRITFEPHSENWNANLGEMPDFLPSEIEREHCRGGTKTWNIRTFKQLDPGLPREFFDKLQMLAVQCGQDKVLIKEKELFILKIRDQERNSSKIYCRCRSEGDTLQIRELRRGPTRLLVADLCWAREWDLRLMVAVDTVCVDMSREEKEGVEKIVRAAVVDPLTARGVRWPAGFIESTGLLLKQVRRIRWKKIVEEQTGRVWKFIEALNDDHRSGEDVSTSFEVDLRLGCWKMRLKDVMEQKDEVASDILDTFPATMEWVHRHCLSVNETTFVDSSSLTRMSL